MQKCVLYVTKVLMLQNIKKNVTGLQLYFCLYIRFYFTENKCINNNDE